jgi:hypothetical protein
MLSFYPLGVVTRHVKSTFNIAVLHNILRAYTRVWARSGVRLTMACPVLPDFLCPDPVVDPSLKVLRMRPDAALPGCDRRQFSSIFYFLHRAAYKKLVTDLVRHFRFGPGFCPIHV